VPSGRRGPGLRGLPTELGVEAAAVKVLRGGQACSGVFWNAVDAVGRSARRLYWDAWRRRLGEPVGRRHGRTGTNGRLGPVGALAGDQRPAGTGSAEPLDPTH
jgi:hypothetical protein